MKKLMKPLGALALLALLCLYPERARQAAWEALSLWARSVVPALLPFLIALPALSGEEACALYRRLLGRLLPRVGLAGEMAGTVVIGLTCGSPAGAASLQRLCAVRPMDRNRVLRCAWFASGASPAFLLTSVARGMLREPRLAWLLVAAQWGGQALCLVLMHRLEPLEGLAQADAREGERESVVWQAARSLLLIGGYMTFFSVLAALLAGNGGGGLQAALGAVLEVGSGCSGLAKSGWPLPVRACLISACASLGGLSSCLQAYAFLKPLGIPLPVYLSGKVIQALLSAGLMGLLLPLRLPGDAPDPYTLCAALALMMVLCVAQHHHKQTVWPRAEG